MLSFLEVETGFIELSSNSEAETSDNWTVLPNGVQLQYPEQGVLNIKPAEASREYCVISCGVHGNETAPIEIVSKLISQICKGLVTPAINLLFILGNPESMLISKRFVSINMNRLFNGAYKDYEQSHENQYELARAEKLESVVHAFFAQDSKSTKRHLDLHTAIKPSFHKTFAIRPYSAHLVSHENKKLLEALGIEAVLQHNKPSTTFSAFSVEQFGAEAYTLELGKVKPFGANNIEDFKAAVSCLNAIVQDKPVSGASAGDLIEYKVVAEIIKKSESFKFHVSESVENFTAFPQGYLIAEDEDYNYRVAYQNESVVFPNPNVPVGQRVAVMVTQRDED